MFSEKQKARFWKIENNSAQGIENPESDKIWAKKMQDSYPLETEEIFDEILAQFEGDGNIIGT